MSKKLGQEPAFPAVAEKYEPDFGMSKRFYAACAAMQGMMSNDRCGDNKTIIKRAYEMADELLSHENM